MKKGVFIANCVVLIIVLALLSISAKGCDMGGVACVSDCLITCLFFAIFWQL